MGMKNR